MRSKKTFGRTLQAGPLKTVSTDSSSFFSKPHLFTVFLYILLFAAAVQSVWILLRGYSFPILDMHSFRQTQTALTVYWIEHGGPLLIYETPVIGAPWAIPFEFPFFHWIVAGLRRLSGLPLDACGRIISYVFFLLTLVPLRYVVAYFYEEREAFIIACILLLSSPLYLFWSRTFMIESTALFASVSFIACVVRWVQAPSAARLAATTLFATFAALQKVTTFVPAALVAGAIVLDAILRRAQGESGRGRTIWNFASEAIRLSPIAIPIVVSIALFEYWLKISDRAKELNPIGELITSSALTAFNFGAWPQRTSEAFWMVVGDRMLPEAVGTPHVVIAVASAALALNAGWARKAALILVGFLAGLLIFANLHFVHNYYQNAISIYLILAIAFAVYEIGLHRPFLGASALMALIVSLMFTFYAQRNGYFNVMLSGARLSDGQTMQLAKYVAANTPKDSVVIGFGYDWSSELPYYSERKALMIPAWITGARLNNVLADPTRPIGGLSVGAIIICPLGAEQKAEMDTNAAFAKALAGMKKTTISACEVYRT